MGSCDVAVDTLELDGEQISGWFKLEDPANQDSQGEVLGGVRLRLVPEVTSGGKFSCALPWQFATPYASFPDSLAFDSRHRPTAHELRWFH
jgi:hypothetical protein